VAYTGAGISTPAGIGDYASKGKGSVVGKEGCRNRLELQPTKTHRVMAAMEKKGLLHEWINQNHDGLAQKAGYPFAKLNEIHGGWFDKKNPVVLMDGTLRNDLWQRLQDWSGKSECVLAMGTSLCGMGADLVCHQSHQRHAQEGIGQGLVIINLQRTPLDDKASLRIFARTDDVFACLAKLWRLKLDTEVHSPYPPVMRYMKPEVTAATAVTPAKTTRAPSSKPTGSSTTAKGRVASKVRGRSPNKKVLKPTTVTSKKASVPPSGRKA